MKLSIAFFAAVSAVPSDFPLPDECNVLSNEFKAPGFYKSFDGLVNCWFAYPNPSDFINDTIPVEPSSGYGNCGFQWKGGSMQNSTCEGFAPALVNNANWMIGNAAFMAKGANSKNEIVGLDMSGDLNIIQSWEVESTDADFINEQEKAFYDAKTKALEEQQNITGTDLDGDFDFVGKSYEGCKVSEIAFNPPKCKKLPDGYYPDFAIMITNQHAGDDQNNYAIANYGNKGDVITVTLGNYCEDVTAHDENQCSVQIQNKADCTFTAEVLNGRAQLFYFQTQGMPENVDFYKVVIA